MIPALYKKMFQRRMEKMTAEIVAINVVASRLPNGDQLQCRHSCQNEDDLKNEDSLKYEDNLKNEDNYKMMKTSKMKRTSV